MAPPTDTGVRAETPPFTVLIPARLASTRLPNKPLADLGGAPMVVRVAQRARMSRAARCVVAADSESIVKACCAHGVEAVLTRADHPSGSDRLAEACTHLGLSGDAIVVNVQGDEPLIDPALVAQVARTLEGDARASVATACHAIHDAASLDNPNVVKVVMDAQGGALYFSRSRIPYPREGAAETYRHIGLYAYRASFLERYASLAPSPLERAESLEQLRVLWHGFRIAVAVSTLPVAPGVDSPQDLEAVRKIAVR